MRSNQESPNLPPIYKPGTVVILHLGNLEGVKGTVTGVTRHLQDVRGNVMEFTYTIELENTARMHIPDKFLEPVAEETSTDENM